MDNTKILNQEIMPLHALPVYKEETNFVLTEEEMKIPLIEFSNF